MNGVDGKECGNCNTWRPLSEFHNSKSNKGGKAYACKDCAAEYRKTYNKENAERFRQNYLNNIEKVKAYRKERYKKERDMVLKARKEMSEEERNKINAQRRLRYPKHRDKYVANAMKRRTILNGLEDDFTVSQREDILKFFGGCALTGDSDFQWDHAISINTGHGGTTYGNMIPLKEFFNKSKKDRNIIEWFNANKQRFELSQEKFDALIDWLAAANNLTVEEYKDHIYWCYENPHSLEDLLTDESEAI